MAMAEERQRLYNKVAGKTWATDIDRSRPISAEPKNYDSLVVDPDEITSLELISHVSESIELKIFLKGRDEPMIHYFGDMKTAIRFYEELWVARKSGHQGTAEIGELGESDGT